MCSKDTGYFLVYRGMADHPVVGRKKNHHYYLAWLYLVETAAWDNHTGMHGIQLNAGELIYTHESMLRQLRSFDKWWTINKIRLFFSKLIKSKMIEDRAAVKPQKPTPNYTTKPPRTRVATICNYSKYQDATQKGSPETTETPTEKQSSLDLSKETKIQNNNINTDIFIDFRDIWNDLVARHSSTMVHSRKPTDDHKKNWKRHIKSGLTLSDFARALEAAEKSKHWILGESEGWRNKTTLMNLLRGNHIQDLLELADDAESDQVSTSTVDFATMSDEDLAMYYPPEQAAEIRKRYPRNENN